MYETIYFKSDYFDDKKSVAQHIYRNLKQLNLEPIAPIDCEDEFFMSIIIDDSVIDLIMGQKEKGKNRGDWYILPVQRVSIFRRIFRMANTAPETKAKKVIENIIQNTPCAEGIVWRI